MKTARDLARLATAEVPNDAGAPPLRLEVSRSAGAGPVVGFLAEYFGADDARRAVELVVDGASRGYLRREALYDLLRPANKALGFDGAAGARLPGRSRYRIVTLACPHPGCEERVATIFFDPAAPPHCPRHETTAMQRAP